MKREKKNQEIEVLKKSLLDNKGLIISKYSGLSVDQFNLLRKEIRSHGASLRVYKNTLSRIAFKGTYAESLSEHLEGPNFLVFTDDPTSTAKVLSRYADEKPENIEIKAGYYEVVLDKAGIKTLATLPSKEILIGKLVSILKSSQVRLVFTLKFPVINFIRTLKAFEAKKV